MINKQNAGLLMLVAGETVHSFGSFAPDFYKLRHAEPGEHRDDLKIGEATAVAWSLIVAIVVADALGTYSPLLVWAIALAVMMSLYEWAERDGQLG